MKEGEKKAATQTDRQTDRQRQTDKDKQFFLKLHNLFHIKGMFM
jgi:hypothetical protein